MSIRKAIRFQARLARKAPRLPAYFVVSGADAAALGVTATSVVDVVINGHTLGRRTIKAWGKGVDDWFVELTAPLMTSAALAVGDALAVALQLADIALPPELQREFARDAGLEVLWSGLSDRERRERSEHIRSAKGQETRERRARAVTAALVARSTKRD